MLPELIRKKEFELLYDNVMERQNIVLSGTYGSGKNYLIKQLKKKLTQRRVCISINMVFLQSWEDFLVKFQKKINKAAKESGPLYMHLKRFLENNPYPIKISAQNMLSWIETFSYSLEQTGTDFLFIIKNIDQQSFIGDDQAQLIEKLVHGRTAQLLISTSNTDFSIKSFTKIDLKPISSLNFEENLLSEKMEGLLEISRGNLQLLEELVLSNDSNAQESLYTLLRRHHRHFLQIQPRFTTMQWNLLKAIALDEFVPQPHAFEFLVKHHLGAASSVERALANLKTTGFITKIKNGWQVTDVYLQRWLQWIYASDNT